MSSSIAEEGDLISYGQVVLFGDSITEQSFNPEFFGSGSALANAYARRLDVMNRGFSGYTTDQALKLLPRIFPGRRDNVKLVVFFFGANDAVLPGFVQHVPLDRYLQNAEEILCSDALKGKVIAVTPPPIEGYSHEISFGPQRTAETTRAYGAALRDLCLRLEVPCADVWSTFMDAIAWKDDGSPIPGSLTSPKDDRLASFFRDGLHPVGSGYRLIYETIAETISSAFPSLDPLVTPYHTPYWAHAVSPEPGEVVRYLIDTSHWTQSQYNQYMTRITPSDREKVSKFYFAKDRYMALGSILLQRHFITQVLGVPEDRLASGSIPRDANNRPFYRDKSVRFHDFNVSHHAGTVVLAAVLEGGRIGIDLTVAEVLAPSSAESADRYLSNFRDSFSPTEWAQIDGDLTRFAQHWALKESFVKATGTGIIVHLPSIEFRRVRYVNETEPVRRDAAHLHLHGERQAWSFELQYVRDKYIALATDGPPTDPRPYEELTF